MTIFVILDYLCNPHHPAYMIQAEGTTMTSHKEIMELRPATNTPAFAAYIGGTHAQAKAALQAMIVAAETKETDRAEARMWLEELGDKP
jgi:hypothetical protein